VSRPWWIPHVFGRIPPVGDAQLALLGVVSLALFFEAYDLSMGTSALKYIAADLHIDERALGGTLGAIRLGAVPAFFVVPFADRLGRRRVFLTCVAAASVTTFATAFVRTTAEFVGMQMLTRTALATGASIAIVIVTEEFPAAYRGWALGILGALSACGHGLGAVLFAAIDRLPWGWRTLYALGLGPLLLWRWFRRGVPETRRFRAHAARSPATVRTWLGPLVLLARTHPARALAVAGVAGLLGVGEAAAFQFSAYYALTAHGWTPAHYSAMVLTGGGVGIVGNVVAGTLGDRVGRRWVGATFLVIFPVFVNIFYRGPGWALPLAFAGFVFCNTAGGVIVRALSTELFPTSHRGTSAGWVALVWTLGWAAGLGLVGLGTRAPEDIARLTSLLSASTLVAGLLLLVLPETNRRELEVLSMEAP
jgi:MFS family permease